MRGGVIAGRRLLAGVKNQQQRGGQKDECDDAGSVVFELEQVGFGFHGSIQSPAHKLRELKNLRHTLRKSFFESVATVLPSKARRSNSKHTIIVCGFALKKNSICRIFCTTNFLWLTNQLQFTTRAK